MIEIYLNDTYLEYLIYSVFIATNDFFYMNLDLDYQEYIDKTKKYSWYDNNISVNVDDEHAMSIRSRIAHVVMNHSNILGMHGFYLDEENKKISFDVIVSFNSRNMDHLFEHVVDDVRKEFPDYKVDINMDTDVSD